MKAQANATGAAILVIVIAAILILYVLVLPPEDRAELLDDEFNGRDWDDDRYDSDPNETLLQENVGRLDYLRFDEREYELPSFRIYSEVESVVVSSLPSIYVKSGIGKDTVRNITFDIDSSVTSDVQISFNVADSNGRLIILLNGNPLFEGEVALGNANPITIPNSLLRDENVLTVMASEPGLAFWSTHEYSLNGFSITADVLDTSNSINRQYFYLTSEEIDNLETLRLRFYPSCNTREAGVLKIYLNALPVFDGVADCGVYRSVILDKDNLYDDRNELEFVAEEGSYLIDRLSIKSELEELSYPVYYFDIDEDLFNSGEELDPDYNVTMKVTFTNREDKELQYIINGRKRTIDTDELIYYAELTDYVRPVSNSIELIPRSILNVAELKVTLDEE